MTMFLVKDGFINLDHVTKLKMKRRITKSRKWRSKTKFWTGDKFIGTSKKWIDPGVLTAPIVAAAAGAEAVVTYMCDERNEPILPSDSAKRPTEADMIFERYPIVAWRIELDSTVTPILPIDVSSNAYFIYIVMPDGALMTEGFRIEYKNLDELKARTA